MIRPLTRKRSSGTVYTRPASVEAAILAAVALPPDERVRRARLRDRNDRDRLLPEVIVYLIRDARRAGQDELAGELLEQLQRRSLALLLAKVPNDFPGGEEIRQAVLDNIADLVADDVLPSSRTSNDLDFYEVRFNLALQKLRLQHTRRILRHNQRECPIPDDDSETIAEEDRGLVGEVAARIMGWTSLADDDRIALSQAIQALPPKYQIVVQLHFLWGLEIDSTNPTVPTVAAQLRITRPAVEKRLKKALKLLREILEMDHG